MSAPTGSVPSGPPDTAAAGAAPSAGVPAAGAPAGAPVPGASSGGAPSVPRCRLPGPPSLSRTVRPARRGGPVPGLRYRPAVPADPGKVREVDRRLEDWARRFDLFPPAWLEDFAGFQVGRAVVLQHPGAADLERLTVAGELLLAENLVDDCYCENEGKGGSPRGLGGRLIMAQSAIDPYHGTPELEEQWRLGMQADGPLRSYHLALRDYAAFATPSQSTRFVHDIARLHLGYLAEAAWTETGHVPEVWEYLVMRQFNNFRPCLSIVDAVDGYELPEAVYSRPEIQRITALACNATTIVNDLYSFTKELAHDPTHLNLPQVIAAREKCGLRTAYLRAVEVHNRVMQAFEEESAELSATSPVVARYAEGLAAWVAGNHEWHATNSHRYHLPNYW
ncbi:family 2 encapsulin nanocompartment cargo protein terpene cyclase [Streptacidiphilus griseoplanus]|uniref:family 2 encapsulin nanocompartment cargo protein terpene cyclase n=1 Tax=Peterkaempfera griseoplana TaxID=66896 RepID=UPI000AFF704F|nr:family 2 encapsulin nanocompartment cargo protein terpene cyclase [Peterkaempfera griseoplana]